MGQEGRGHLEEVKSKGSPSGNCAAGRPQEPQEALKYAAYLEVHLSHQLYLLKEMLLQISSTPPFQILIMEKSKVSIRKGEVAQGSKGGSLPSMQGRSGLVETVNALNWI